MIKKFMSKALLSIFMDKKARTTLDKARAGKNQPEASPETKPSGALPQSEPDTLSEMNYDEITALIRDSLDAAEHEVIYNKKKALDKKSKSTANPSRQDLINKALAIHKSQSHIFDDLPEDQRQKLKLIAFQAFGEQLKNS
tara:strand:+ start:201 stop:623 length:423 start_codon:yes stop_codon:yes gene_type:complete